MCNTSKGAKSSSTIYSVVETAKVNGLVVEKYLIHLIDVMSNLEVKDKDTLLKHMPWSKELPEAVRLQNKNVHGKNNYNQIQWLSSFSCLLLDLVYQRRF